MGIIKITAGISDKNKNHIVERTNEKGEIFLNNGLEQVLNFHL